MQLEPRTNFRLEQGLPRGASDRPTGPEGGGYCAIDVPESEGPCGVHGCDEHPGP
jgi:hypothetical protein